MRVLTAGMVRVLSVGGRRRLRGVRLVRLARMRGTAVAICSLVDIAFLFVGSSRSSSRNGLTRGSLSVVDIILVRHAHGRAGENWCRSTLHSGEVHACRGRGACSKCSSTNYND